MKKNSGNLTILSLHDSLQDRLYYKADLSISLDVRHPHSEPAVFMTKEYVLILCLKGSASFVFNMGKKVVLHEKCLIFLMPNTFWELADITPDAEFYVCCLSQNFFSQLHFHTRFHFNAKHIETPVLRLTGNNLQTCKQYFALMYSLASVPPSQFQDHIILDLLQSFFNYFTNCYKTQTSATKPQSSFKRSDQLFSDFYKLTKQYALQEHSIRFYAQKMGITEHNLSNAVKRATQKTPKEWLDMRILHRSKILLMDISKSVSQISEELHFATPSHFGFFFKKNTGITPKQFRKNMFAETSSIETHE